MCDDTGSVTIEKTPTVEPDTQGQDATWTLTVTNTGPKTIKNVGVTAVLDDGLIYVSSTQSGDNSGQTTIWTSNEYRSAHPLLY